MKICNGGGDWVVTAIGIATSIYMLFMVQALRPFLVGGDQQHVHQPSMSPLLERVLVCITFPWSVKDLVQLESTLATIATYETNVHTLVLTDDASRLDALLSDWGRSETTEAVQMAISKRDDDLSCGPPVACTDIIGQHVSEGGYTSISYLEPGTRLTWTALASWALDTEVLEALNLRRCFYHTTLSPETGEKVLVDWVEPISVQRNGKARVDAMLENPTDFERVSSRGSQLASGSERGSWARGRGACTIHRHFVSIDLHSCPSTNTRVFTRKEWETYMQTGLRQPAGSKTTEFKSSCVVPYVFTEQLNRRPVLAAEAEVYEAISSRALL